MVSPTMTDAVLLTGLYRTRLIHYGWDMAQVVWAQRWKVKSRLAALTVSSSVQWLSRIRMGFDGVMMGQGRE